VWQVASESGAAEVLIATDDQRIRDVAERFGAKVIMTGAGHPSGTDRVHEAVMAAGWPDQAIVVNLQGDEPLVPPELVAQVASTLASDPVAGIATLATPVTSLSAALDPNVVKVVSDADGRALYFSRAPLPFHRDGASAGIASQRRHDGMLRHVGLYAYRVAVLKRLAGLPPSPVEEAESLEQLRALWHGIPIAVARAAATPQPGVDTPADLERVRKLLANPGG
jgi:3-deoxy-manno-octulosonate cytidylyltransferase (CMP-KDO synthetase)